MTRPVRWVLVSCSLSLAVAGCASQPPPKSPEERIQDAQAKIEEMKKYSEGEATYAEYREALQEIEDAKKDLREERSSVAEEDTPYEPGYPYPYDGRF